LQYVHNPKTIGAITLITTTRCNEAYLQQYVNKTIRTNDAAIRLYVIVLIVVAPARQL
jgi:hypothetical protein